MYKPKYTKLLNGIKIVKISKSEFKHPRVVNSVTEKYNQKFTSKEQKTSCEGVWSGTNVKK